MAGVEFAAGYTFSPCGRLLASSSGHCAPVWRQSVHLNGASIANISANLLLVAPACNVPHANCSPAKLIHQGSKVTVRTCGSLPLRDLQDVHEGLRADMGIGNSAVEVKKELGRSEC